MTAFASAADAPLSPAVRRVVLVGMALALVLPLWIVRFPPLIDYPNHLARAFVLHHLNDPGQIFSSWYAADWEPNPYLVVDLILQALQYPLGIYAAGRVLLSLCVLAVPAATWLFLRQASPGNEYLALWSLVVAYDTNFLMGFLSFQLSMALCFLVTALWLAYAKAPGLSRWLVLLPLTTMLYFTHIGGFAVAAVAIVLSAWFGRRSLLQAGLAALLFVPGALLFLQMKRHSWANRGLDYSSWHFSAKLVSLTTPFRGYSRAVDLISISLFAGALLLVLIGNGEVRFSRVWLAIAAAILAVHWIVPERYGDLASIDTRFPPFAFLFALAVPCLGRRKKVMIYAALAVFLLKTGYTTLRFQAEQPKLETLATAFAAVPEHARVLACVKAPPPEDLWVKHGEYHFWAYGVISRGWVSPSLFHQKGVQPLLLRKDAYLGDDPDGSCSADGSWDWSRLRQDHDFVWAYDLPSLASALDGNGSAAYTAAKLVVYRLHKD
ncbi:MAG TPA: hypothetical protein VKB24_06020 [Candidatus Acidoferrum sp.]|nr:hypothetical protein [Candidatus Acidoferrum sp.]